MKQMNINYPGNAYELFRYPAGELQVRLASDAVALAKSCEKITVKARILNAEDVMAILNLGDAIRGISTATIILQLPYLPYSRADRRFTDGDCFALSVFGRLLDTSVFNSIVTIDAHSGASANIIRKLVDVKPTEFIESSIAYFAMRHKSDRVTVLFPDAGAKSRYAIRETMSGNQSELLVDRAYAKKKRNPTTGTLDGFAVPELPSTDPIIIVDDICDGGGTFMGIAKEIRNSGNNSPLALCVTHGIFSKGVDLLLSSFEVVYTTSSFDHAYNNNVFVTDAWSMM